MSKLDGKVGGRKAPEAAQRSATQTSEERRFKAEEGLTTMQRYQKVMADPSLVRDIQKLAKEQMGILAKCAGDADGATTRTRGKGPDNDEAGATKEGGPPAAMKKSGGGAPTAKGMSKIKRSKSDA